MSTKRVVTALTLTLALTAGCTDSIGDAELHSREDGVLSRLFSKVSSYFVERAEEPAPIAPKVAWTPPAAGEDPAVDELFDALGLEEVEPTADGMELDGALVGVYEYFPEDDDPESYYEEVCFFAKAPEEQPSQEMLFYAEMYGHRPFNGDVSDIDGKPIEQECVWCEEGNTGGGETRVIFYVNGINATGEKHCSQLQSIADVTGAVTIGVYNESEGTLKDVWQTAQDRFTVTFENALAEFGISQTIKIHDNKAATMLTNLVVQRIRANKHVEIWAHSQGGAVTSLALHRALRALEEEGSWPVMDGDEVDYAAIKVVTFGSAAPKWPFGGFPKGPSYTHYVHLRDATPSALGVGAWGGYTSIGAQRAGADAKMVFFDGDPAELEELHPDDDKSHVFDVVDSESADIGFLDLNPTKYHSVEGCYLGMYEQQHGAWWKK